MSTIKLENIQTRTGSGTITIGASGETVALGSGVTTSGFATTNGITMADQWRLTADLTSNGNITSNLERVDYSLGLIGTGMSESSGQFTFPQTGKYLIIANIFADNAAGDNVGFEMRVTENNFSSFVSDVATTGTNHEGVSGASTSYLLNVTDISNDGVMFEVTSIGAGSGLRGDTTANETFFTFIRLGD